MTINPLPLDEKARKLNLERGAEDYRLGISSQVRGLWKGFFDFYTFVDNMVGVITRGFTRAWYEGMQECGLSPADITEEEKRRLDDEINAEILYTVNFANDIAANSQANGGKLRDLTWRIPLWQNRYVGIRELGKVYACGDKKLKWVINPAKEHCADCEMLDGKVYRASTWKSSGWAPRSRVLACGGFKCGCELRQTSDPITSGKAPIAF